MSRLHAHALPGANASEPNNQSAHPCGTTENVQALAPEASVREFPQVRTRSKHRRGTKALPGWGAVANPEDWKVVDAVPENVLASGKGEASACMRLERGHMHARMS